MSSPFAFPRIARSIRVAWVGIGGILAVASAPASAESLSPAPPDVAIEMMNAPATDLAKPADARDPATAQPARQKSLEFENNVIEGMNRDPLDAAEHVGRKEPGAVGGLYRKKPNFKRETSRLLQETGYSP